MPKRLYHRGQRTGIKDIEVCLNLPGLLDLAFLIGGDELLMSSDSTAIALFPFFAPGMMERLWSNILDLYP